MKVIFFGSSSFSIPVLDELLRSSHEILHVITTPDQKKGRGQKVFPSPVKAFAKKNDLPFSSPSKLKNPDITDLIAQLQPDFIVVASYGKLIPASIFTRPKLAPLNVHPSLLPRHRGASPLQMTLYEGDSESGVSIAEVTQDLDAGDVFAQTTTPLDENENAEQLSNRLALMGAKLTLEVMERFERGTVTRTAQDSALATYAKKIEKEFGRLRWGDSSARIHNQVRACTPWPSAFTFLNGKRLKILETRKLSELKSTNAPGCVIKIDKDGTVAVQTKEGAIQLLRVQPEGKRVMSAYDFALGHHLNIGTSLGS